MLVLRITFVVTFFVICKHSMSVNLLSAMDEIWRPFVIVAVTIIVFIFIASTKSTAKTWKTMYHSNNSMSFDITVSDKFSKVNFSTIQIWAKMYIYAVCSMSLLAVLVLYLVAETTYELELSFDRVQQMQQDHHNAVAVAAAAAADDDDDDDDDDEDDEKHAAQNDQPPSTSVPRPRRKTVNVGSAAVLDCDVDYPLTSDSSERYVQHIVTWRRQGVEAPVFLAFDGYPPRVDSSYVGRVRAVGPAAIEIRDVTTSDEGWYECTVLFIDQEDKSPGNGTWTYLAVNSTSAHLYYVISSL